MAAAEHLHELIDSLSPEVQEALASFLEHLSAEDDPVERAYMRASLLEPEDLSEEDMMTLKEAEDAPARGNVYTQQEIEREFLDES